MQHTIPIHLRSIDGHPLLSLKDYGKVVANGLSETMEQGYAVIKNGKFTALAELTAEERLAVQALLDAEFPQHAKI